MPATNSNRGQTPHALSHRVKDRQPMLMIVCGETGVGKTYRSVLELFKYLKDDPEKGKFGRKIIGFDANGDDFPMFRTVALEDLSKLRAVQARRILPIHPDGSPMTMSEKRDVVAAIVKSFKNGLIVLEDPDKYMVGAKGQDVVGLLTTNRHSGLDIVVSHQSVAKITTTEWENCTWLRLHHQVDDISRYKNRIPNYFIVRIASFIVNEQYSAATQAANRGEVSPEEYRYYKSFFVYVDMRKLRIRGCSKGAYIRACKRYIDTEEQRRIKTMLLERDGRGKPVYKDHHTAALHLLVKYMRHYEATEASPLEQEHAS